MYMVDTSNKEYCIAAPSLYIVYHFLTDADLLVFLLLMSFELHWPPNYAQVYNPPASGGRAAPD